MSADLAPSSPGIDETIDGFFQPLMETSSDLVFWGIYLGQCKAEEMNIYPETWKGLQVLKPYMNNLEKLMPLVQNKGNEQKTA